MIPKFHQLTISHLERFGDFAMALGFAVPDELAGAYRFLPGQYLTLRADIDGEEVRRPYSICTPPHSGVLGGRDQASRGWTVFHPRAGQSCGR